MLRNFSCKRINHRGCSKIVRYDYGEKRILVYFKCNLGITFFDPACGFRVIIMAKANSQVNTRVLELLPKFKIKKMNRWCFVEFYENKYYNYIIIKD